jgi:uncharacterized protein YjbJ (UPF0337 family)
MSIVDKVKELLGKNVDQAEGAVDKAASMIDERTGGKYADKVDMAQQKAKDYIEGQRSQEQPPTS